MHSPETSSSPSSYTWHITGEHIGLRLDRFLVSMLDDTSRTTIQQLISNGGVLVNGRSSKSGYALREGDEIQVHQLTPDQPANKPVPQAQPLDIVYEDSDLWVVNKQAGMVVHPAPGHSQDTLINALLAYHPNLSDIESERPGIVHRLDRDTSGLIIVAKNLSTQSALIEQMKRHEIIKRYLALVEGVVSLDHGSIDAPIGRDPRNRQKMAVTATGSRDAVTHFRVLERFHRHTLLLLQLETGRTHQIRVHLQAIGHPVFGDPTYGSGHTHASIPLHRQFLHAYQLLFTHPTTGQLLELEAPLPPDLEEVLRNASFL
ncbi:MAG TPA: RluA family pseudouridine synthase [Ktedonobacteraceae bacterium]|nr:RluA family pseudouridine synthase [Ktedonobacteraceae bacterium]